jgi:hypothetical protein
MASLTEMSGKWDLVEFREELPVQGVPVIGNWIRRLSWWVIVVFATTLVYKLVLFSPGLCHGEGGTNAHVKKGVRRKTRGYC